MARRACAALVAIAGAGWLGACQSEAPPAAPAAALVAAAPAAPVAWASASDCRAKLGLLEQAVQSGRLAAGEPVPIAVVLPDSARADDWLAAPQVTVAGDLPLAVYQRSELAQLEAPCLLLIEPPRDQRVEHRVTDRQTVRSFYQSGSRSERNPDYDLAQLRVRQAERDARDDDFDILSVGDPMIDLVGTLIGSVVSGFSQGKGERDLEDAMLELTSTPRSLDQPVYRAYEFEQATVLAGKEATIPIALLERASGRAWRAELRQRERREFAIIDDLDPRDRDYEARRAASLDRHQFERWQREPPRLELSALAAALRDTDPTASRDGLPPAGSAPAPAATVVSSIDRAAARALVDDLDAAMALPARAADRPGSSDALWAVTGRPVAPASRLMAAGNSRAAAVVGILADAGAGSGVYVRDDLVLTTATLVARASVVEVVAADGAHVLGLVARTDRGRNLALVQVAKPGAPALLHDGPPLAAGRALEALLQHGAGRATLASGRYLGAGPALAAFTGVVYIDAPALQDQPEATPWFLGDALVALGMGAAAGGADGPLGAIGAAEMRDFLYGAGGALAALP